MKAWASLLLLVPINLMAANSVTLHYEALPELIQKSSKDVKAAEALIQASAARQGYLERSRYPRLDVETGLRGVKEVSQGEDTAPFLKVEGSLPLYRGNRDALKDAVQEKETAFRKEEAKLVLTNQLSLAREYYIRLAKSRELQKVWVDAIRITDQKKKSAQTKVNAGLTTNTDLLEFDLHEVFLKREKRNLDKEEHEMENRLCILLGLPEGSEVQLETTFSHPPQPTEGNFPMNASKHPLIRKISLQAEQAETSASAEINQWSPDVNLYASYESFLQPKADEPSSLPERDFTIGVRISVPMGDNLSQRTETAAKMLEASALNLQRQRAEEEIKATFHENLHDMTVLHELIHDSEKQLEKARQHLTQTSGEYERGVKNGPDVLEASRTLYRIEVESIELLFDYYRAEASMMSLSAF